MFLSGDDHSLLYVLGVTRQNQFNARRWLGPDPHSIHDNRSSSEIAGALLTIRTDGKAPSSPTMVWLAVRQRGGSIHFGHLPPSAIKCLPHAALRQPTCSECVFKIGYRNPEN
jgi:hypothetical protein